MRRLRGMIKLAINYDMISRSMTKSEFKQFYRTVRIYNNVVNEIMRKNKSKISKAYNDLVIYGYSELRIDLE